MPILPNSLVLIMIYLDSYLYTAYSKSSKLSDKAGSVWQNGGRDGDRGLINSIIQWPTTSYCCIVIIGCDMQAATDPVLFIQLVS